jgi:type II secretory pathway component PulF
MVGPASLILLLIPAVAVRIAVRALYGPKRLAPTDPMQMLLNMASNVMFALATLGMCVGLFGFWVLLFFLPFIVPMLIIRLRYAQHRALLWSLATAAQRGIPLSEAARAYADETLGDTGLRALVLAESIERGESLSGAATSARLWMNSAVKFAVRLGERLGLLGPAIGQHLHDTQHIDAGVRDVFGRFVYLLGIVSVMAVVSSFVMFKIVPVFQRMFQDFGLKLPALTQLVIDTTIPSAFVGSIPLLIYIAFWIYIGGVILGGIALAAVRMFFTYLRLYKALNQLFRGQPYDRLELRRRFWKIFRAVGVVTVLWMFGPVLLPLVPIFSLSGWFPRDLPLIWRLFKRYDGALMMRGLALTVRRGLPIPQAMQLVADCYPITIAAGRLRWAADRAAAGIDWRDSFRQTGLISHADAAVLGAAERVGNLDWALEEMADSAIRRQIYRIQAILQIIFPIALLILGSLVALFVIGLFIPLISLIQGLT